MFGMMTGMEGLTRLRREQSRAINAENPYGEKGKGGMSASPLGPCRKGTPCIPSIEPGETRVLAEMEGPGVIRHIWMTVTDRTSDKGCYVLRDLVIRMYWDGEETPSVESPLGDFFCCGFARAYEVNSLPVSVNPTRGFNCYFPMPFGRKARITVENQGEEAVPAFFYQVDYGLLDGLPEDTCYFHAQWRRTRMTRKQEDHIILDGVRGAGQYVGTFLALTTLERYWWGEGEVKFYLDGDVDYPTVCGTGTEDYFGGAWSFAAQEGGRTVEQTYCTPFLGYPYYSDRDGLVHNAYHMDDCPPMRGLYRFHVPDPVCFAQDIKVTLQQIGSCHRGIYERQDDVATVAYWYQTEPHQPFGPLPGREERWPR